MILFLFTVYLNDTKCCKMQHGGTDTYWSRRGERRDSVSLQKAQNDWTSGLWGTCDKHCDNESGWRSGKHANDENLPVSNSLERSLFKRGPSRRAYKIRILEARYPCKNPADVTEPSLPSACEHENGPSLSAGSFYGDKPASITRRATEEEKHSSKRVCGDDRLVTDDSICSRVFQALGNDLIVEWLTPQELHSVEIAFDYEFDWGRAWHGGRVKNRAVAARIQYELQQGLQAEQLLAKYDRDFAFSALWYLVGVGEIERLAEKFKHYKTIKKLCRFLS